VPTPPDPDDLSPPDSPPAADRRLRSDRDDLSRERRPPVNRNDRPDPPPTAERFFPRSARRPAADHHELADEPTSELHPGADAWPAPRQTSAPRETTAGRPSNSGRVSNRPRPRLEVDGAPRSASDGSSRPTTDGGPRFASDGSPRPTTDSRPGNESPSTADGRSQSAARVRPAPPGGSPATGSGPAEGPSGSAETSGSLEGGSVRGGAGPDAQGTAEDVSGPELARAVIDAALTKRRAAARSPRPRSGEGSGRRLRGYSGPGPDPRDPQLFGDMLQRLMKARGWERPRAEAMVFGAWEKVVGPDIAKHSRPVKLDAGVLTVEAESTAWATQLRLLTARLLKSIAAEVGHNVVTRLNIHGPAVPTWTKGPRRVQGRGPRDTYG
jgi:predicted nucleic acid-binding Zn ribbon protein